MERPHIIAAAVAVLVAVIMVYLLALKLGERFAVAQAEAVLREPTL